MQVTSIETFEKKKDIAEVKVQLTKEESIMNVCNDFVYDFVYVSGK